MAYCRALSVGIVVTAGFLLFVCAGRQMDSPPSMLTVTVNNALTFQGKRFFHTARALGHDVLLLGTGDSYKGNGDKVHKLKVALESLQVSRGASYLHETVIFFTDSTDVVLLAKPK